MTEDDALKLVRSYTRDGTASDTPTSGEHTPADDPTPTDDELPAPTARQCPYCTRVLAHYDGTNWYTLAREIEVDVTGYAAQLWQCPTCSAAWPRDDNDRSRATQAAIDAINRRRRRRE